MKFYVYYNDDFYEMGGVGIDTFDAKDDALKFITERIKMAGTTASLRDYVLIEGKSLTLKAVEVATKLEAT